MQALKQATGRIPTGAKRLLMRMECSKPKLGFALIFGPFVDSVPRQKVMPAFSRSAYVHFTDEGTEAHMGPPAGLGL